MKIIRVLDVEKDFEFLIPIIEEIRHTKLDTHAKEEVKLSFTNLSEKNDSEIFVCEINNETVAYITYHIVEFPLIQGKETYITELFVNENYRGQKIGTDLLDKVKELSKAKGVKRMSLLNSKEKKSYKSGFYKKYGFVERDVMSNFVISI